MPRNSAVNAVIITLAAGDAVAVQGFAGAADHIFDFLFARHRNAVVNRFHCIVEESSVRLTVFHTDLSALRLRGICGDAEEFQRFAVDYEAVAARSRRADRNFG